MDQHRRATSIVDLTMPLGPDTPIAEGDPAVTLTRIRSHEVDGYQVTAMCLGSHSGTHLDAPRHFLPNGATLDTIPVSRFVRTGWVIDVRPPELAGERQATDGAAAPESSLRRPHEAPPVSPLAAPLTTFAPGGALAAPNNPLPLVTAVSELAAGTPPLGTAAPIAAPPSAPPVPRVTADRLAEKLQETAIEPGDFLLLWTGGALLADDALSLLLDSGASLVGTDAYSLDDFPYPAHPLLLGHGVLLAENLANLDKLGPGRATCAFLPLLVEGADGAPMRAVAWR